MEMGLNNPTTQQFTAAYKRLLLRSSIQGRNGDCQTREQVDILHAISNTCYTNGNDTTMLSISEASLIRKYDLSEMSHTAENHDEIACPSIVHLPEFKEVAISYIAGFVAQMATKQLFVLHLSLGKAILHLTLSS